MLSSWHTMGMRCDWGVAWGCGRVNSSQQACPRPSLLCCTGWSTKGLARPQWGQWNLHGQLK